MNFNSFEEILDFAIEREKQAVAFYQKLVDKETFPASKQTLAEFVEEERNHQTLLEEFKRGNRTLVEYDYEWIPDIKRSDYIVDMKYEPGMDFAEILRLAMKREEKALRLYNALATKTDDADCIRLFKMLAQEEAKHKQTFETIYDDHMPNWETEPSTAFESHRRCHDCSGHRDGFSSTPTRPPWRYCRHRYGGDRGHATILDNAIG